MKIVKNFLCCLSIETGGFVIGYLSLIGSIIWLLSSVYLLVKLPESILPLLFMWISSVYIYASFEIIQATKRRSSETAFFFLVLNILTLLVVIGVTIFYLVQYISYGWNANLQEQLGSWAVSTAIQTYVVIVITSLHGKFMDEQYPTKAEFNAPLV